MLRIVRRLGLVAVVLLTTAASCISAPSHTTTTQTTNLNRPWGLAVEPGAGRLVFTERDRAQISVQLADGSVRVFGNPAGVATAGEGGLLGIAMDPGFTSNHRLYVCFSSTAGDVRVARYVVNGDFASIGGRTDIVTGMPYSTGRHAGCQLKFGPDGRLWITAGDAAIGTTPQDLQSLGGKVLRVDTNGNAPADNPFVGNPYADDRIYTYGHRNPQGIAFEPGTGAAYAVEHGPRRDDEVNRLVAGANYGWNPVPGYNESVPMTDLAAFPNAIPAAWSSGSPTIAPGGAAFISGSQWTSWDGGLAVAVLKNRHLRVFQFGADGSTAETFSLALAGRGTRIRNVVQGLDGAVYVATDGDGVNGSIIRLDPS